MKSVAMLAVVLLLASAQCAWVLWTLGGHFTTGHPTNGRYLSNTSE